MSIPAEELQSLSDEERLFENVRTSLESQISRAQTRLRTENERARAITSEIMHTRRVEDKALLASDEAVSHGLKDSKREELDTLTKQVENPYFARIELEEEQPSGSTTRIEYKLGFAANTDCRIIDWRRAPISKLYYEYKEGDEYCEEILGRERNGQVILRNRIEIAKGELEVVENRYGTFVWNPKEASWQRKSGAGKGRRGSDGALPEILALITAQQFRSITVDADTAVLIQGIAGSGKTTVALHRLAWLLHHDNSPLKEHEAAVIVLSPSLRAYIANSLPAAGIRGVCVRTYHEWAHRTFRTLFKGREYSAHRPMEHCPLEVAEVKRSVAILTAIDAAVEKRRAAAEGVTFEELQSMLLTVLSNAEALVRHDPRKRITESAVKHALERTREDFEADMLDWNDDALLLRIYQRMTGSVINEQGRPESYGHVVVDEVQDLSPVELATLIGCVKELKDLTLVGDVSQNLDRAQAFPGWEALQRYWNFDPARSRFVSLEVSYRSTLPIMRLADYIQKRSVAKSGRAGRTPIWFMCRGEAAGIECALKWLTKAGELYPNRIAAVICATPQEAKFAYEMLKPTFGPRVRLGDATSFSFEEGVLVTDVRQVKGLEFFSVLLWNPSARAYSGDDLGRNLLYVAVTRAEENLSIVTWNRAATALPPFAASNLIRSMDLTIVEDDDDDAKKGRGALAR
jgi:DNA helicase-2/ATP-dependent DNA helicase PcrA